MGSYIIKAGKLIDSISEETLTNMGILVEKDIIQEIKPFDQMNSLGCPVIDHSGETVLSGIFNCHVHMHSNPVLNKKESDELNEADQIVEAYLNLQKYINTGVTYIRNQGSPNFIDLKLKKMVDSGKITGPSIMASGPNICMTGGHGHQSGLESDGPDQCRKSARYLLKNGVQTVKLMATGGVMTEGVEPGSPQLTYEEIKAIVEEANKAGRPTSAHAQGTEGIYNSVKAGITSVEHGIYLTDEIIDMMLEKGVYLVPTLAACYFILRTGVKGGVDAFAVKKTEKVEQFHFASFRKAYARGVKIALGTDAGTPFNMHDKTWYEMKLMIENGMDPMAAIKTATIHSAALLGVDDEYGTLEAGKKADIIAINGDPIKNIDAFDDVKAVYKHGKKIK